MSGKILYQYAVLPLSEVAGMLDASEREGSYLSEDGSVRALRKLLAQGYRWIRSDGDWAVFELRGVDIRPMGVDP